MSRISDPQITFFLVQGWAVCCSALLVGGLLCCWVVSWGDMDFALASVSGISFSLAPVRKRRDAASGPFSDPVWVRANYRFRGKGQDCVFSLFVCYKEPFP